MKKLLIVLLALTVIGVFAFADDAMAPAPVGQFHAWNYGMLFAMAANGSASSSTSVGWGPSWDPNRGIDQEWTFAYDGKDYGFSGTFEFGMGDFGESTTGAGSISWFDTYYKFGDFAKFTAGKLDIGEYRWTTFIEGAANARFGQRAYAGMIQVYPIEGLSLAVLENVPGNTTTYMGDTVNAVNFSYGTFVGANYQNWTNVAASYVMKDMGKVYFAWNNTASEFSVGVNISAVKPLSLQVVYDDDYAGGVATSTVWITGSYTMDALALTADIGFGSGTGQPYGTTNPVTGLPTGASTLTGAQVANGAQWSNGGSSTTAFAAEIKGEYTMGKYAVGALVGYDNGAGMGLFNGQAAGWTGLELYPYVKANFDNGSYITIGVLYASGANGGGQTLNSASWNAATPGYSQSLFAIPISYCWAF
jgi:hypothetical protein